MTDTSELPSTPTSRTRPLGTTSMKNSTKYKFHIQSAPPLSLQQYIRSTVHPPNTKRWQTSGKYRPPIFTAYLSPEVRREPKPEIRVWRPPSPYREPRPTAFSPENKPQPSIHEPAWKPAGKTIYEPIPYFDQPNLRWSVQELRRSLSEMTPRTVRSSSSMSRSRKTDITEET
ncbi:unnamed protein product [Adineta ricciae]|uniref:Uncharacterized protein n=1 Tax=Adineta ricciae TaxID=249248 RepID=A0A815SM40_ADIRI|nr:unnamed protein product [Adineta ricciae]